MFVEGGAQNGWLGALKGANLELDGFFRPISTMPKRLALVAMANGGRVQNTAAYFRPSLSHIVFLSGSIDRVVVGLKGSGGWYVKVVSRRNENESLGTFSSNWAEKDISHFGSM